MRLFRSEKEKQPSEVRPDNESTCPIWSGVVVGLLGVGSDSMERLDGNRKVVACGSAFGCVLGAVFGCCCVEALYCLMHVCICCCIMIRVCIYMCRCHLCHLGL